MNLCSCFLLLNLNFISIDYSFSFQLSRFLWRVVIWKGYGVQLSCSSFRQLSLSLPTSLPGFLLWSYSLSQKENSRCESSHKLQLRPLNYQSTDNALLTSFVGMAHNIMDSKLFKLDSSLLWHNSSQSIKYNSKVSSKCEFVICPWPTSPFPTSFAC